MLMALNSLDSVQKNPTIKTTKQITRFLNYSATHADAGTEYRRRKMIPHIYLDSSHI